MAVKETHKEKGKTFILFPITIPREDMSPSKAVMPAQVDFQLCKELKVQYDSHLFLGNWYVLLGTHILMGAYIGSQRLKSVVDDIASEYVSIGGIERADELHAILKFLEANYTSRIEEVPTT